MTFETFGVDIAKNVFQLHRLVISKLAGNLRACMSESGSPKASPAKERGESFTNVFLFPRSSAKSAPCLFYNLLRKYHALPPFRLN